MDTLRTAYTMALLPRAARPAGGRGTQMVTPADSYLSLSSGILRIVSAGEALWKRAGELRRARRGQHVSGAAVRCGATSG